MAIGGGCLCGAVTYELSAALGGISHCYCRMCRKQHGAAFATYGTAPRSALVVRDMAGALRSFRSSPTAKRTFCSNCGSSLFFEPDDEPDHIEVALGTLNEEPGPLPEAHIFVRDKPAWIAILDDLPQYPASRRQA
jgi:hypothetical protein